MPLSGLNAALAEYEAFALPDQDEATAFDQLVTRPRAVLSQIRAAGSIAAGEEAEWAVAAASLCMRHAKGHDEDVLPQIVRGKQQHALGGSADAAVATLTGDSSEHQAAATNLLEGSVGMSPHAIMNRYLGFKVLAMLLRWLARWAEGGGGGERGDGGAPSIDCILPV